MTTLKWIAGAASALVLGACATATGPDAPVEMAEIAMSDVDMASLTTILEAQPDEVKARYGARNPAETIAFFGIEPGMTVVEALPGGGWYTKILMPYVGADGTIVGAQYPDDMWGRFGFGDEFVATRTKASAEWADTAAGWGIENAPTVKSFQLTQMDDDMAGMADAVLFIRALHNMNRFNDDGGYMDAALAQTFEMVKPGGIVGVVQHAAPEDIADEMATGATGYLKESAVVAAFEAAGFVLEASSDVNVNTKDVPGEGDIVWRLPPTLNGTEEGTPERAAMEAIGESNRMTLRFRKPA